MNYTFTAVNLQLFRLQKNCRDLCQITAFFPMHFLHCSSFLAGQCQIYAQIILQQQFLAKISLFTYRKIRVNPNTEVSLNYVCTFCKFFVIFQNNENSNRSIVINYFYYLEDELEKIYPFFKNWNTPSKFSGCERFGYPSIFG